MKSAILLFFLNKIAPKIGNYAANTIKEALLGKPTSLDNVHQVVLGMQKSIDLMDKKVADTMTRLKFANTVSRAEKNIDQANYAGLLEYLDDGKELSYWYLINSLCNSMYSVSAREMERQRNNPENIDFNQSSLIRGISDNLLRHVQSAPEYVATVSGLGISVSAAAVSATLVATEALLKIKECPEDHPLYEACMERVRNPVTQKYLPISNGRAAGTGLAHILAPALAQGPRAVMGIDLAEVFEAALPGQTSIEVALRSARFKDKNWFLDRPGLRRNPNLVDRPVYWRLSFSSSSLEWITIRSDRESLFIGFQDGSQGQGQIGVRSSRNRSSTWQWFIYRTDSYGTVVLFRNGTARSPIKNVLSTTRVWPFRPNAAPGGGRLTAHQAFWQLRPPRPRQEEPGSESISAHEQLGT